MFGKIAASTSIFLAMMFFGLYYYESGIDAPVECVELHNDYVKLSQLIQSDNYKDVAHQLLPEKKIENIHNINKHYQRLLTKQFKRNGFDEFKKICINAKESLNIDKIIQNFEDQKNIILI